jgi:hypothetical protein
MNYLGMLDGVEYHRAQLAQEAALERLAAQAVGRRTPLRVRVARALRGVARVIESPVQAAAAREALRLGLTTESCATC